ncbi:hypothetical protein J1605_019692 [Eschrichtius robustus]|uniref:Uncharacterized protein n=1 Tax=Eschrichtius robustus TaxID=9764 RepID=A0AB34HJY7_ESCRO|nr:hypothetical protein J1605_019692 [Eschrichtius robustus]
MGKGWGGFPEKLPLWLNTQAQESQRPFPGQRQSEHSRSLQPSLVICVGEGPCSPSSVPGGDPTAPSSGRQQRCRSFGPQLVPKECGLGRDKGRARFSEEGMCNFTPEQGVF